jgi:DNA invertase Pin-like site-specific DNA recombinase
VNNRLGQVHFSHEPVADRFHGGKPVLSGMVDNFQREDVLIVTDFSKLSYSTVEVLGVLSGLSRTGVRLYVINSGFRLGDNMQSQVVAMACFLVSQIEQDLGSS